jgi:acetylornithine/succinyldiaminopimelate/putrescine aminotransferase
MNAVSESSMRDARAREAATTIPVYGQLPFVPDHTSGCEIVANDGKRILDLYGGHAVAALGYGHPRLLAAIREQSETMLFQSNAVALDVRARAAEKLVEVAPDGLESVFFVNSGAEANENALRMACAVTGRSRILAITGGFHGRTAAAGAVTWKSDRWYGFPQRPFDVDFIPRDDCDAARAMIDPDVAAVIFEPVQGVAGAFDLAGDFVRALREQTAEHGALLIADEVQSGVGRCGHYYAIQAHGVSPDILTSAKALGGGIPCGAVLCRKDIANRFGVGDLGTTFGGGPVAAGAIVAVLDTIESEGLLQNVRDREAQIRSSCVVGPVEKIQGMGLLLGLVCKQPATAVRDALLEHGILAGTSADPHVLRILAPLVITAEHVEKLAAALASITCEQE